MAQGDVTTTIIGNVCADVELKYTPSGAAVAKFTVAATPRRLDKASGEWADGDPLFMRCTAWRELGENVAESLVKGSRVIVQGRLKQDNWEDKQTGAKRSAIVMEVDEIGPSLRFAQAQVTRVGGERGNGGLRNPVKTEGWTDDAPF
jgi:single-strand DNA-binding protein